MQGVNEIRMFLKGFTRSQPMPTEARERLAGIISWRRVTRADEPAMFGVDAAAGCEVCWQIRAPEGQEKAALEVRGLIERSYAGTGIVIVEVGTGRLERRSGSPAGASEKPAADAVKATPAVGSAAGVEPEALVPQPVPEGAEAAPSLSIVPPIVVSAPERPKAAEPVNSVAVIPPPPGAFGTPIPTAVPGPANIAVPPPPPPRLSVVPTSAVAKEIVAAKQAAYQQRLDEAFRTLLVHCDHPEFDAEAQRLLGCCYHYRETPDFENAVLWFRKAAESGDAAAMFNLARLAETGRGMKQDYVEALRWYEEAVAKGDSDAAYNLAFAFLQGTFAPANKLRAIELFTKAAMAGHASAQFNLGLMFYNGDAVETDYEKASLWLNRAAAQGHAKAKIALQQLGRQGT